MIWNDFIIYLSRKWHASESIELVDQKLNDEDFIATIVLIQSWRPRLIHVLRSILSISCWVDIAYISSFIPPLPPPPPPPPQHRPFDPSKTLTPSSLPLSLSLSLSAPAEYALTYMHLRYSHGKCEWKRRRLWKWRRRRRSLRQFEPRADNPRAFLWSNGQLSAAWSPSVSRSSLVFVAG